MVFFEGQAGESGFWLPVGNIFSTAPAKLCQRLTQFRIRSPGDRLKSVIR